MPAASAKAKAKSSEGGAKTKQKPTRGKENKRPPKQKPTTAEKEACGPNKKKSKCEEVEKTEPSNNTPTHARKKRTTPIAEEPGNVDETAPAVASEEASTIKRMRPRQLGGRVFPEEFFRERCAEATSAAPSYIERHALYPRPVVGKLECVYVGFDVSKDAIKADTDVHFE